MATTTTDVGRLIISHQDLGYEGGASLHAQERTNVTKVADNMGSRFSTFTAQANGTTFAVGHNFGMGLDQLEVFIFSGSHPALTEVDDPTNLAVPYAIAETSGSEKTSIDITVPASGGPFTGAVIVLQSKGAEVKAARVSRLVSASETLSNKRIHLADSTGGAITLTLPDPDLDLYIPIKDIGGDAVTNNISIATPAAELIDGAASYDITADYESIIVVSDGTNYFLI